MRQDINQISGLILGRFKFYVYSAFYDKRASRMIRIIGATRTRSPERVWCRFWYDDVAANDNATGVPERRR
jgi:hypothetical protein